jgi:hypothetical protein
VFLLLAALGLTGAALQVSRSERLPRTKEGAHPKQEWSESLVLVPIGEVICQRRRASSCPYFDDMHVGVGELLAQASARGERLVADVAHQHGIMRRSNMRLPITFAPVRSNVSRMMSLSRPSSPPD